LAREKMTNKQINKSFNLEQKGRAYLQGAHPLNITPEYRPLEDVSEAEREV